MSKPIKVSDQVYQELDMVKEKGETFSQVVERLLEARAKMFEMLSMVEGVLRYQEWKQKQFLKAVREHQAIRSSLKEVYQ